MKLTAAGRPIRWLVILGAVALISGCTTPGREPSNPRVPSVIVPPTAVVFVANGAGDARVLSQNLSKAAEDAGARLQIETVAWSTGRWRFLADELDRDNHLEQG